MGDLSRDCPQFHAAIADMVNEEVMSIAERIGRLEHRVLRCTHLLERMRDKTRRAEGFPTSFLVKFKEPRSYEDLVAEAMAMHAEKVEKEREEADLRKYERERKEAELKMQREANSAVQSESSTS